jgi:hypothetical protein
MGDGCRVLYGHCGCRTLAAAARAARPRCWCGRTVSTLPDSNGIECAEHDAPWDDRDLRNDTCWTGSTYGT